MAEPTPPIKIWANTPTTDPETGFTNVQQPPDAYLAVGYKNGDFVPRQYINWFLNMVGQWLGFFKSENTQRIADIDAEATARIAGDATTLATAVGFFVKKDGSTPFTGTQAGVTPTAAAHLTRKDYVDAADTTIAGSITTEATARAAADTTLQANIDAEATARAAADTTLQANINAEAAARLAELEWTAYSPALAIAGGGTISGESAKACRYVIKGKMIWIQYQIDVVAFSGGSPVGLLISLPTTGSPTLSASMLTILQDSWVNNPTTLEAGISARSTTTQFSVSLISGGSISTGFSCNGLFVGELA